MKRFRLYQRTLARLWNRLVSQARVLRREWAEDRRLARRRSRRVRSAQTQSWVASSAVPLEPRLLLTTTITSTTDLSGYFDAQGNFSVSDSDQITIESGVVITTSSSSGAAGSISLSSPLIVLQPGAQLLATGSTSAGDGAITLTANKVDYGTIANPLFQMGQELFKPPTNSTIQIGSNVLITGGAVNIQTWAGESIAEQNYANSR